MSSSALSRKVVLALETVESVQDHLSALNIRGDYKISPVVTRMAETLEERLRLLPDNAMATSLPPDLRRRQLNYISAAYGRRLIDIGATGSAEVSESRATPIIKCSDELEVYFRLFRQMMRLGLADVEEKLFYDSILVALPNVADAREEGYEKYTTKQCLVARVLGSIMNHPGVSEYQHLPGGVNPQKVIKTPVLLTIADKLTGSFSPLSVINPYYCFLAEIKDIQPSIPRSIQEQTGRKFLFSDEMKVLLSSQYSERLTSRYDEMCAKHQLHSIGRSLVAHSTKGRRDVTLESGTIKRLYEKIKQHTNVAKPCHFVSLEMAREAMLVGAGLLSVKKQEYITRLIQEGLRIDEAVHGKDVLRAALDKELEFTASEGAHDAGLRVTYQGSENYVRVLQAKSDEYRAINKAESLDLDGLGRSQLPAITF